MRHSDRKISVFACDLLTIVDRSSLVAYSQTMIEVVQTELFADWFEGLRDRQAKARIQARIDVILLSGGDKSTQDSDIQTAKKIAKKLED
jgi:putative component of toxin-antitoxin plasmid stabilization module